MIRRQMRFKGYKTGSAFLLLMALLLSGQAQAHSVLLNSTPAADQTVPVAAELTLNFNEPVRLVRLSVSDADGQAADFGFRPEAAAKPSYSWPLPTLSAGVYTVNWALIGADGHTVVENFSFTVDPKVAPSPAVHQSHSHDHSHGAESAGAGHSH